MSRYTSTTTLDNGAIRRPQSGREHLVDDLCPVSLPPEGVGVVCRTRRTRSALRNRAKGRQCSRAESDRSSTHVRVVAQSLVAPVALLLARDVEPLRQLVEELIGDHVADGLVPVVSGDAGAICAVTAMSDAQHDLICRREERMVR